MLKEKVKMLEDMVVRKRSFSPLSVLLEHRSSIF